MSRRVWVWPLVVLVVAGALPVGQFLVRKWVDRKIERNVGRPLPEFALTSTDGRTFSTQSLRGKVVALHFFRSFCGSCEQQKPVVRELESLLDANDVVLLSVMTDRIEGYADADTQATLERSRFTHPVLLADRAFADAFHGAEWANVTPIWYIADRAGNVVATLRGTQTKAEVQDAIAAAQSIRR